MLSKAQIIEALQVALPEARLMWEDEGGGQATVIITIPKQAEHYVGLDLTVPGLTVPELVKSILGALEVKIP